MLKKADFEEFISKVGGAYSVFCVWMYTNNQYATNKKILSTPIKDNLCISIEEYVNNSPIYKNFFSTVIPSLQHTWILSTARLIDSPYFRNNESKPRLSIHYIKNQLEDKELATWLDNKLSEQRIFLKKIKELRDNFLAHNDLRYTERGVKAGIEFFFNTISDYIKLIKNKKPHLNSCNDLLLKEIEALSQGGVKEIFDKIIPQNST